MDSIIDELLSVDVRAQKIVDEAQDYYNKAIENIEKNKKQMLDNYNAKAQKHMQNVVETEELIFESKKTEIVKNAEETSKKMNAVFNEKRQIWENELFERCVGGE